MRYFLDPFGCAKNQVDAENMMAHLNASGWSAAGDAADADIIIVNSCGFIESAKQESINAVLCWRKLHPGKKILLAGCLAQRYSAELAESLPEADGILVGTGEEKLGVRSEELGMRIAPHPSPLTSSSSRPLLSLPGSAYVKISEGCDNRCSYCAIPLIRGPLRCRTVTDIVEECRGLLARGIKELCIIGQDIGSYCDGGLGLPELLLAIAQIPGDFWVRLLYLHPAHFPIAALDVMERDARFLPYFDLPFQHASPKILSAMNRRHTAEEGLALIETIRSRFPAAVIRTTFLAGFPGETEEDFAALLDFQEKIRADWLGCFAYSREEGTSAFSMKSQVPLKTAVQRKQEIESRQIPIAEKNADRFIGQTLDVLLEEQYAAGEQGGEHLWLGRLYCHAPEVDGAAVIIGMKQAQGMAGEFVSCRIIARRGIDLECRSEYVDSAR